MNVGLMGKHLDNHEKARRQLVRAKFEMDLSCMACGVGNRPGRKVIELDEYDDARCEKCGYVWAEHVVYE